MRASAAFSCGALWGVSLFVFMAHGTNAIAPDPIALALLVILPAAYAGLSVLLTRQASTD